MLKPGEVGTYKRAIQETLTAMRYDDVGIAVVAEKDAGTLAVALSRWGHTQTLDIPIDDLQGKKQERAAMNRAILDLTRAIEKETRRPESSIAFSWLRSSRQRTRNVFSPSIRASQ